MRNQLISSILISFFVLWSSAKGYNPCADVNSNGQVDLADLSRIVIEHTSVWGLYPPFPANKGDIDGRAGYNEGDVRFFISYLFGLGPEGGCPPFPAYNLAQTDDIFFMPKILFGSGSGTAALPIVFYHDGYVSDFLLPLSIRGLGPNVVADSLIGAEELHYHSGNIGSEQIHWPEAYLFWSVPLPDQNSLSPGLDTIATLYVHYNSVPGESLAVDAAALGPHTFPNYVTSASPTTNYGDMTIAIPRISSKWTILPSDAIMRPDPQYVYYQFSIVPIVDTVYFGNFPDGKTAGNVNPVTVMIDDIVPTSVFVTPAIHGFDTDVVAATFPLSTYLIPKGGLYGEVPTIFNVSWEYYDASPASLEGFVLISGKNSQNPSQFNSPPGTNIFPGDVNLDGQLDISDAVSMIQFIFASGPISELLPNSDVDCSTAMDISDVIYLLQHIFSGGPAPCLL